MDRVLLFATGERLTQNLSIFAPAAPAAASIRDLSILVFAITGFIFVVVEGVLIYTLCRFRRRAAASGEPPQVYGSKPIEIAWTAAPALIVFILLLVITRTLWEVSAESATSGSSDERALQITVVGRQWWWEYQYESYNGKKLGFTTANELHIPASAAGAGRRVYLTLKSADVCHSFWVPRLAGKTDLIPGRTNLMWLETDKPGLYLGQCAEYCGTQHANMLIRLVVDEPGDFERWLANEARPAVDDPSTSAGKAVFLGQTCVNCHRVRGTSAQGTYAPDLTHLMSRSTIAAGMVGSTARDLTGWIEDPQAVKPGCLMPAFNLDSRDRARLVDYLLTLR
jgi:cytochrome c oxidase subunit 2